MHQQTLSLISRYFDMSTITPNMNLVVPTVGSDFSPNYALEINQSLSTVDSHDHSNGSGVQINPSGININSALTFANNPAINLSSLVMIAQSSSPTGNGTIYESSIGDIHYINGSGLDIQITNSSGVAVTPTSIPGLVSPASVNYVPSSQTFVWQSDTNIAANMDFGSALLRNLSPNSTFALTLSPPAALGSNYSIILPTLPASQKIMTLDASGNMAAPYMVDNSTIIISSNVIEVPTSGIGTTQIADGAVTTAKLASQAVTAAKIANGTITTTQISPTAGITTAQLGPQGAAISSVIGTFSTTSTSFVPVTNMSVNVTANSRPVDIQFFCDSTSVAQGYIKTNDGVGSFRIRQTTNNYIVNTGSFGRAFSTDGLDNIFPLSAMNCIDVTAPNGVKNYILEIASTDSRLVSIINAKMAGITR